jgi:hypothetical protein
MSEYSRQRNQPEEIVVDSELASSSSSGKSKPNVGSLYDFPSGDIDQKMHELHSYRVINSPMHFDSGGAQE